jgi:hypothetical protein
MRLYRPNQGSWKRDKDLMHQPFNSLSWQYLPLPLHLGLTDTGWIGWTTCLVQRQITLRRTANALIHRQRMPFKFTIGGYTEIEVTIMKFGTA